MTRNITPLNETVPAPEAIPDRSELAKLYKPRGAGTNSRKTESLDAKVPVNAIASNVSFMATITINLLVALPYIVSFISIVAIYSLGEASGINEALENRIATILLTIPALLPWVFSIRVLRNHLSNYRMSAFGLVVLYALFILPVLDISLALRERGILDGIILAVTFVLSQIYIWSLAYVLNSQKSLLSIRATPVAVFVLVLIVAAVLV